MFNHEDILVFRRRTSPEDENVLKELGPSCRMDESEEAIEKEFKGLFPNYETYSATPVKPHSYYPPVVNDRKDWCTRESYGGLNNINIILKAIKKPVFNFRDW